ncbi:hypothetical protein P12x_003153 [Tundrisphaera lichenicola]|uniref:hypothetical protein n=1 Tax=Tundrisphaera lichenicola TaxID=2029860 RepID=UPI003EB81EAB
MQDLNSTIRAVRLVPLLLATVLIGLEGSAARAQAPRLLGRWLGQDGHDLVGGKPGPSKNDYQDIHLQVRGIPPNRQVVETIVKGFGGGEWKSSNKDQFTVLLVRKGNAIQADLYVEPYQVEKGREIEVHLKYDDGSMAVANFPGGRADPNLKAAGAGIELKWVGQDGQDRTGPGPNVGPDGAEDVHLSLAKLSPQVEIKSVEITGPGGLIWHAGHNPAGHPAAEVARNLEDRTRADLYFAPGVDLAGKKLQVSVTYENDRGDLASVVAGKCNPSKSASRPPTINLAASKATARWLGQDGVEMSPGDVHVALEGLTPDRTIVAAALSDSVAGTWVFQANDRVKFEAGAIRERLNVRRSSPTKGDLVFPPIRDESGATMTLRFLDQSGREEVLRFPGGSCDPDRRAPALAPGTVTAKPGDDLNGLAARFGTINLSKGIYPLTRPLVLTRPTRIIGEPGATLQFSQGSDQKVWTAAIKIHAGSTTLEGFAVRFVGPIRWDQGVSFGPAVIGTTDDRDSVPADPKFKITLARLDLEGPAASSSTAWEHDTHLIRVNTAATGRIEGNTLRGGSVLFAGGPWTIVENTYKGTPPNTFCNGVFSGRYTHDLKLIGNKARPEGPSGKTWRFLVLTQRGMFDLVKDNVVEGGIGPREDDPHPHPNAPELMLTEAYRLHFEGKPASISADGRVLVIHRPQGGEAFTGDALAILEGPQAGEWRTIAQPLGAQAYLLDEPISKDTGAVSIATGFVRETFEGNTVDCRGSGQAANLVLAGNVFGARVVNNHFLGGGESVRLLSAPTEEPVRWGWSHAPFLGGVFEGNILEDAPGGSLGVEHGPAVRSSRGRVYMTLSFKGNTLKWSGSTDKSPRFRIGFEPSIDPHELIIAEEGTRVEGAPPRSVWVHAATINGKVVKDGPLKTSGLVGSKNPTRRN